MYPYVEVD
jgi:hypothetical protein